VISTDLGPGEARTTLSTELTVGVGSITGVVQAGGVGLGGAVITVSARRHCRYDDHLDTRRTGRLQSAETSRRHRIHTRSSGRWLAHTDADHFRRERCRRCRNQPSRRFGRGPRGGDKRPRGKPRRCPGDRQVRHTVVRDDNRIDRGSLAGLWRSAR
jgi:hypothetical protein